MAGGKDPTFKQETVNTGLNTLEIYLVLGINKPSEAAPQHVGVIWNLELAYNRWFGIVGKKSRQSILACDQVCSTAGRRSSNWEPVGVSAVLI